MHLLAIETSGARGGIALLAAEGEDEPTLLEEVYLQEGFRHARDLLPTIRAACDRAGWSPRAVDALAISIGPGSFTGVRIAVVLAKFMAYDAAAQVVPVPSLRAMAAGAPPDRSPLACIRDAKRGGLYASVFERRAGDLVETFGPALARDARPRPGRGEGEGGTGSLRPGARGAVGRAAVGGGAARVRPVAGGCHGRGATPGADLPSPARGRGGLGTTVRRVLFLTREDGRHLHRPVISTEVAAGDRAERSRLACA